jgi:hypothetical protein
MLGVAIGIFVAGAAVAIAVPLQQKSVRHAQAAMVAEDLRDFAHVFHAQVRQEDTWPPATNSPGQVPAGMEGALDRSWSQRTPIGGGYLWAPDALHRGQRYRATIMLWPTNRGPVSDDPRLLEEIDRLLDDGDLRSGNFQLGYRDQPFFVLEP